MSSVYSLREKTDKKFSRYNEEEFANLETLSCKRSTTKKAATKRKHNSNETNLDEEIDENTIIDLADDSHISQASLNEKQEVATNKNLTHDAEFLKLIKEREEYDLKLKEKELLIEEKLRIIEQQKEFIEMVCSNMKHDFMCKICKKILDKPIDLPCSITICKSHLESFMAKNCDFCNQSHQVSNETTLINETLNHRISLNMHYTQTELELKQTIEHLLYKTKTSTQLLKEKEIDLESIYASYFSEIVNNIDLRSNELKTTIDQISTTLKNLVKECKSLNKKDFEMYTSNKTYALDEVKKIESNFNEELRKVVLIKDNLENTKRDLIANLEKLTEKFNGVKKMESDVKTFSLENNTSSLNFSIFGKLSYGFNFFNHLECLNDSDLEAKGLKYFKKYQTC